MASFFFLKATFGQFQVEGAPFKINFKQRGTSATLFKKNSPTIYQVISMSGFGVLNLSIITEYSHFLRLSCRL